MRSKFAHIRDYGNRPIPNREDKKNNKKQSANDKNQNKKRP